WRRGRRRFRRGARGEREDDQKSVRHRDFVARAARGTARRMRVVEISAWRSSPITRGAPACVIRGDARYATLVSSTHSETRSRDGRFVLHYRCKDSWGDASYTEERWELVDARFGCTVISWSNEGERTFESIEFTFAKNAVRVRHCDGRKELFA